MSQGNVGWVREAAEERHVPIDQGLALLCAFEGEKAVWAKAFTSEQDAIEAAGLRAEQSAS